MLVVRSQKHKPHVLHNLPSQFAAVASSFNTASSFVDSSLLEIFGDSQILTNAWLNPIIFNEVHSITEQIGALVSKECLKI